MEGVVAVMSSEPAIDATRIGLVGFSLGGAVAALAAANDRRVGAVVAVTPPFDPRPWFARAQPLLRRHLATIAGGEDQLTRLTSEFALPGVIERVRCPMLVFGAGRDLIVPPEEAIRFCVAVGERGTLLWYPDGRHGLYEELSDWTTEAARWLSSVLAGVARVHPGGADARADRTSNNGVTRRSRLLLDSPLRRSYTPARSTGNDDPTTNVELPARRRLLTTDKP